MSDGESLTDELILFGIGFIVGMYGLAGVHVPSDLIGGVIVLIAAYITILAQKRSPDPNYGNLNNAGGDPAVPPARQQQDENNAAALEQNDGEVELDLDTDTITLRNDNQ